VKDNDTLRPLLGQVRRAIVPKIGQLTNDQSEIDRISTEIIRIVNMQPPPPEPLYFSILSALAKAILMQAETEVSARAVTAIPLSKVTIRLLSNITLFPEILYARMVQRTGGWAVPVPVPKPQGMGEVEYAKLRGFRSEREPQKDFDTRVIGIMTLYFAILTEGVSTPMPMAWAFPRYWTYFARLMSMSVLLRSDMALQIIAGK
jgi:nucleoporin GLE1